ncbi:MAG TPA: histidine--tRNA ligase [Solirubrobacteraceae bacterium]|nr:histidine--tRNA ligase [Solirubrobacteraceae bacterium]
MTAPKLKAPRGTFDVLGPDAAVRSTVEAKACAILEGAGYERIETPAFEATELFARGVGASTDIVQKEMYTFDDGAGRSLTLRPEGTAPVCRAYVEHGMHKRRQPVKLWYLSSFFRHERAQAGRYREFWQVGAEALGSEDPAVDAESIGLLRALLDELGVAPVRLRLSSLGSPDARASYREQLQLHLRAHEGMLSEDVRARIELNPLRAFDSDHPGTRQALASAPLLRDFLAPEDAAHFAEVRALLEAARISYEIDPTLVRGLDYYTRTVFELTSERLGAQSGVGGGGRYDGLVEQLGGPATAGMGWAAGVERMLLAGSAPAAPPPPLDLFIAFEAPGAGGGGRRGQALGAGQRSEVGGAGGLAGAEVEGIDGAAHARARTRAHAFALLIDARAAGLVAQMELGPRSLKNQLSHANALGARYVAILGPDGTVLKDMAAGQQETIATDTVIHAVLRGRRDL